MPALTAPQLERLNKLVLSAFDAASLAQFLRFKLDIVLENEFGANGTPLKNSVFAVVTGLQQRGMLADFIEAVRAEFPARTDIQSEFPTLRQAVLGTSRPVETETSTVSTVGPQPPKENVNQRPEILKLFKKLKSHQFGELFFLLGVPPQHHPSDTVPLVQQQNQLLKWTEDEKKLDDLLTALCDLTGEPRNP